MRACRPLFLLTLIALSFAKSTFAADVVSTREMIRLDDVSATRLLEPIGVYPYERGYVENDGAYVLDAGDAPEGGYGVRYAYQLDQKVATPVIAICRSRAENVGGNVGSDYSLYVDVNYTDGTNLWGSVYNFPVGDSDWTQGEVTIFPEKPIKYVSVYGLLRGHSGKASFKDFELRQFEFSQKVSFFDGVPVKLDKNEQRKKTTIYLRDVAKDGAFCALEGVSKSETPVDAFGLSISSTRQPLQSGGGANRAFKDVVRVKSKSQEDRALSLVYSISFPKKLKDATWVWFDDPRRFREIDVREYSATRTLAEVGAGRGSHYPFGVVAARNDRGEYSSAFGIAIDPNFPAFYRIACNGETNELYIVFDFALTKEKPEAEFHILPLDWELSKDGQSVSLTTSKHASGAVNVPFGSNPFRACFDAYRQAYPKSFFVRAVKQGNWMAFAKISNVPNDEDFGFQFKEGIDELAEDDARNVSSFRYTEPMTWWQQVPKSETSPKSIEAAYQSAKELAIKNEKDDDGRPKYAVAEARSLMTTGFQDKDGAPYGMLLDTPWCDGVVWSLNDAPGLVDLVERGKLNNANNKDVELIAGFATKWSDEIADGLYGKPDPKFAKLRSRDDFLAAETTPGCDGEYVDSSEGYVTAMIDFNRAHFAGMQTPLVFDSKDKRPGIMRGLIAFEYVKKISDDVHARGKLSMANATPSLHFWLAPQLDVLGTETNWHWKDAWRPMPDDELMFRRVMCCGKPYCFLQNTNFDEFTRDMTEKYMKRALAYGMFPSMFSADASTKHYFENPDLYERDRELFKRYMPIVTEVAEAGWEPETGVESNDEKLYVERFGALNGASTSSNPLRPTDAVYLTLFNDSDEEKSYELQLGKAILTHVEKTDSKIVELLEGKDAALEDGKLSGTLGAQDVRVFKIAK